MVMSPSQVNYSKEKEYEYVWVGVRDTDNKTLWWRIKRLLFGKRRKELRLKESPMDTGDGPVVF